MKPCLDESVFYLQTQLKYSPHQDWEASAATSPPSGCASATAPRPHTLCVRDCLTLDHRLECILLHSHALPESHFTVRTATVGVPMCTMFAPHVQRENLSEGCGTSTSVIQCSESVASRDCLTSLIQLQTSCPGSLAISFT